MGDMQDNGSFAGLVAFVLVAVVLCLGLVWVGTRYSSPPDASHVKLACVETAGCFDCEERP